MLCCCVGEEAGPSRIVEPVGAPILNDEAEEADPVIYQTPAEAPAPPPPPPIEAKAEPQEEAKAEEELPKPAASEPKASEPKGYYYEALVDKGGARLGLKLDFKKGGLSVEGIGPGSAAEKYNSYAEPAQKIQVLDYVVDVNGKTDADAMVEAMRADGALKLKMFRPTAVFIKVAKFEADLGLDLLFAEDSINIDVIEVSNGAAKTHNMKAPPESQIKATDVIVSVNGISQSAARMFEELKKATELDLVVIRAPC